MIRQIVNFTVLLALSGLLWAAAYKYDVYYFWKSFQTLLAVASIYALFKIVFEEVIARQIKDARSQYSFRRTVSIIYYFATALAIFGIWVQDTQTLLVSYGLVAAGVAVALQDVFKNFAGGVLVFSSGIYRVGDRIEIGGRYGDVIDIGIMYTTLMEIKEWVEGDQPTGRIDVVPNSLVLNSTIDNYTKQLTFVFEDLSIPITYKSDWRKAVDSILELVRRETGEVTQLATEQMKTLGRKYYVPGKKVEPAVFLTITDNWVNLHVRYPALARERRTTASRISRAILEMIEASEDIEIASTTIDIVGFPDIGLKREKDGADRTG